MRERRKRKRSHQEFHDVLCSSFSERQLRVGSGCFYKGSLAPMPCLLHRAYNVTIITNALTNFNLSGATSLLAPRGALYHPLSSPECYIHPSRDYFWKSSRFEWYTFESLISIDLNESEIQNLLSHLRYCVFYQIIYQPQFCVDPKVLSGI